jgi:hypothetical protein
MQGKDGDLKYKNEFRLAMFKSKGDRNKEER